MSSKIKSPGELFKSMKRKKKQIIEKYESIIMEQIELNFNGSAEQVYVRFEADPSELESIQGFVVESFGEQAWCLSDLEITNQVSKKPIIELYAKPITFDPRAEGERDETLGENS